MGDYHLHLHPHDPSPDQWPPPGEYPDGLIEMYVEAAARRGVSELGFTEHLFRCVEAADALGPFWEKEPNPRLAAQAEEFVTQDRVLSLDRYVDEVLAAKNRGLPVLLGLEVDFFPDTIDVVLQLLNSYPFDFLIGSVHWVGGWTIDHGDVVDEFEARGVEQAYADYFEWETALAASGTVDVLAHADVVKKRGHRLATPPLDLYEGVAMAAAASNTAVEVSSAGLYKAVGEMYPAPEFLAAFYDAGVPITLASDAHASEDAGRGHNEVVAAARTAGYTHRLRFEQRSATSVPL